MAQSPNVSAKTQPRLRQHRCRDRERHCDEIRTLKRIAPQPDNARFRPDKRYKSRQVPSFVQANRLELRVHPTDICRRR